MVSKEDIYSALKTVIDPELGHNIVDLGLIYDVQINQSPSRPPAKRSMASAVAELQVASCLVVMTLTTPGCPLAPFFSNQVKETVAAAAGISPEDVMVDLTFDPPWSPEAIHPDLRLELGI